jgi:flagellar biosynthetic protein FlhB
MADQSERTEEPTQRRLQKAREEGQFPAAREFVGALQFLTFAAVLSVGGARWLATFRQTARSLFQIAYARELVPADLTAIAWRIFWSNMLPLALGGMAVAAATLGFRLITTQFGLSLKKLTPDFARLNPLTKLKELPRRNLPALLQAAILLPLFLWTAYAIARERLAAFMTLPLVGVESGCAVLAASLMELIWKSAAVFLVFGSVDLFRQVRRYSQDLRMSKHEIREEHKDMEGNPQIKMKIRRLRRDQARRHMMKEVPTATAVIVNPTHFAVAIRYQLDSLTAPTVVAKGKNYLAQRIRQKAVENQVPVVENAPLAQALYKSVEVGQEIPPHLYRAVAEILAYIFKLMNGKLPG